MIAESDLKIENPAAREEVFSPTVTESELGGHRDPNENFYLDLRAATLVEGAAIYRDWYVGIEHKYAPSVYYRVGMEGPHTYVQYWLFYAFNDWTNDHEGDWEMIQLVFEDRTVVEVLSADGRPDYAAYSNHTAGFRESWMATERQTTHPLVYVANGSHASYFHDADEGYVVPPPSAGIDRVSTQGVLMVPQFEEPGGLTGETLKYDLIDIKETAWLPFAGHWGERFLPGSGEFDLGADSPLGPRSQGSKWITPVTWASTLEDDSEYWSDP